MIASVAAEQRIVGKLLAEGTLSATVFSAMRRESEVMGLPLIEVLIANDVVSEADAAQVYADLAGVRFLDLTRRQPNRVWALTLAENVARTKDCMIFGEVSNELVAVVADPALAVRLRDQTLADISRCHEASLEVHRKRPWWKKVMEHMAYLLRHCL